MGKEEYEFRYESNFSEMGDLFAELTRIDAAYAGRIDEIQKKLENIQTKTIQKSQRNNLVPLMVLLPGIILIKGFHGDFLRGLISAAIMGIVFWILWKLETKNQAKKLKKIADDVLTAPFSTTLKFNSRGITSEAEVMDKSRSSEILWTEIERILETEKYVAFEKRDEKKDVEVLPKVVFETPGEFQSFMEQATAWLAAAKDFEKSKASFN